MNPKMQAIQIQLRELFPMLSINTPEEENCLVPWDLWDKGDYLIVGDKEEEEGILSGAYTIGLDINEDGQEIIKAVWLTYPQEPIIGIENIINTLKEQTQ